MHSNFSQRFHLEVVSQTRVSFILKINNTSTQEHLYRQCHNSTNGTAMPAYTMNAYRKRGIAPFILNLGSRQM